MKKGWMLLAGAAAYFLGIGMYFSSRVMFMRKKDERLIIERETAARRLNLKEYDSLPKTEVKVASSFGYSLHCVFVHPHPAKKWMVFCHGITENKYNSIKYMNMFLKRGFNAVIYDHRRHGESGGRTSSYGHYERMDLQAVIHELLEREGPDITIGVHGESMGAVTALLYAGTLDDRADFYIADCPFSDFTEQLKHNLKSELPVPSWMVLPIGSLFMKLRDGYSIKDISPINYIEAIQKPVLFIHSQDDAYILPEMSRALYEAKKGPKKLFIAEKGAHAQSYNENRKEYEQAVDEFLDSMM
ncbi:alpha/beta hydrolase [Peribacillus kribbensis]|uniref:alpha/beta hydrolase n=1 Tax=Peribacillus kribbensis TaxID=356658 RepID=UPI00042A5DE6|nr:alpha/beta hydrolase [Peribacillus kribbensis]